MEEGEAAATVLPGEGHEPATTKSSVYQGREEQDSYGMEESGAATSLLC